MRREQLRENTVNEGRSSAEIDTNGTRDRSRVVRQILTLAKVHWQSSDYYRAALMPVIKAAVARLEGRA